MAHACNPSYSGGRSGGSKFKVSPRQIDPETLSQKIQSQERAGVVAQGIDPEFKP
jgi:hypothetical protein